VTAVLVLFAVLLATRLLSRRTKRRGLYLNVQVPKQNTKSAFESVNDILARHAQFVDMRRLDRRSDSLHMTYLLDCEDQEILAQLMEDLEEHLAHCTFSLVDQGNTPT